MFRFRIRDVLWLTVVVAMGVTWKLNDGRLCVALKSAEEVEAIAEGDKRDALGGLVDLYDAIDRRGLTTAQATGKKIEVVGPVKPPK